LFPNEDSGSVNGVVDETMGAQIEMLKTFILEQVVPNIRKRLPESCALVLGKALLWFIYCNDAISNNFLPEQYKNQIQNELNEILTASGSFVDGDNFNPICRVPVIVTGDQGSVFIDVIEQLGGVDDAVAGGGGGGRPATGSVQAQLTAMHSLSTQIRREIHDVKLAQVVDRANAQKNYAVLNSNIRRIGIAPARVVQRGRVATGGNDDILARLQNAASPADTSSLSPIPRNLHVLWTEYITGIGGRKPAMEFSLHERGRVKHKYCRRNVIWTIVDNLVRSGLTCEVAIDRIYGIYGSQTCVTKIINRIRKDIEKGTLNPNLRPHITR
jgi:hypothetical protein